MELIDLDINMMFHSNFVSRNVFRIKENILRLSIENEKDKTRILFFKVPYLRINSLRGLMP